MTVKNMSNTTALGGKMYDSSERYTTGKLHCMRFGLARDQISSVSGGRKRSHRILHPTDWAPAIFAEPLVASEHLVQHKPPSITYRQFVQRDVQRFECSFRCTCALRWYYSPRVIPMSTVEVEGSMRPILSIEALIVSENVNPEIMLATVPRSC